MNCSVTRSIRALLCAGVLASASLAMAQAKDAPEAPAFAVPAVLNPSNQPPGLQGTGAVKMLVNNGVKPMLPSSGGPRGACVNCTSTENEANCGIPSDTVNGGCNSSPPVFSQLACGQSFCGTGAFDGATRDTDWWFVTLTQPTVMTLTVTADFPVQIGFGDLNNGCPITSLIQGLFGNACEATTLTSSCLPAGSYICFVAPQFAATVACGTAQYTGTLACNVGCSPPPTGGDNCADAQLMACGDVITRTNVGQGDDGLQPSCSFGGAPTNNDTWFKFVATSNVATLTTCGGSGITDTVISVYSDCSGDASEIGCNDDANCGLLSTVDLSGLTPGNTYFVRVSCWNGAAPGEFTLSLTCPEPTGACCIAATCQILSRTACDAAGGSFQGAGTDCGGVTYGAIQSCNDTLENISTTGTLAPTASNCDDCSDLNIPIGFSFPYYNSSFTTIAICSNGFVSLDQGGASPFPNTALPNPAAPNNMICPMWDDFNPGVAGDVFYQSATSPTRFIVQWNQVRRFGAATGANTFQVILYQDGHIAFRYGALEGAGLLTSTVGIENADGTSAVTIPGADANEVEGGNTCRNIPGTISGGACANQCDCPGDFNNDNAVGIGDLTLFLSSFGGAPSNPCMDFDNNGVISLTDLTAFLSNFGSTCP